MDNYDLFEELKEKDLEEDINEKELKELFEDPRFRYFLWRLLSYCKAFRTISYKDPHSMAISSGMRDVGLWVLGQLDPITYQLMQQEANDRERRYNRSN